MILNNSQQLPRVAPTPGQPREPDAPIVRKMAKIIRRDDAKKGEVSKGRQMETALVGATKSTKVIDFQATEARASEAREITIREATGLMLGEK